MPDKPNRPPLRFARERRRLQWEYMWYRLIRGEGGLGGLLAISLLFLLASVAYGIASLFDSAGNTNAVHLAAPQLEPIWNVMWGIGSALTSGGIISGQRHWQKREALGWMLTLTAVTTYAAAIIAAGKAIPGIFALASLAVVAMAGSFRLLYLREILKAGL